MTAKVACIDEPISWLRLETFAYEGRDARVGVHVAECPACRRCLDEIKRDVVPLPTLAVPERPRFRWWMWAAPALAAAALAVVLVRPRPNVAANVTSIKGGGELVLGVVRERDGIVRDDVATFATGDRWKVTVTCPPDQGTWIDVVVVDAGHADYPIAPAHVACGNGVVVPGAFELTGSRPNRVCVRVGADGPPVRAVPADGDDQVACVLIRPE